MSATIIPHISVVLLFASSGFVCGVWWQSFQFTHFSNTLFGVFLFSFILLTVHVRSRKVWLVAIFLSFFGVGVFVTDGAIQEVDRYSALVGQKREGGARVVGDVEKKSYYSAVYIQYENMTEKILIKDDQYTELKSGDHISLTCTLALPKVYDTGFDYRMFLAMRGVFAVCEDAEYEVIGHNQDIYSSILQWRHDMERVISSAIPAPHSALANGLLFGGGERLSKKLQDDFSRTGMTHIVAVSGYNVSVIIAVVIGLLTYGGVHRAYAIVLAILAVVLFVALIGFPSSGIRAAIMGSMVLIAAANGRISHAYGAVFFAAGVMLYFNPLLLRYDIGFQLSFLATLGIIMLYPICEKSFIKNNRAFGIVEIIILTLAAQVLVIPIIVYHFHSIPILSLLVNVLVLPIIPVTMLLTVLLIIFYYILPIASVVTGWLVFWLLEYEIYIISFFSDISWSSMEVTSLPLWCLVLYYFTVVFFVIKYSQKEYE